MRDTEQSETTEVRKKVGQAKTHKRNNAYNDTNVNIGAIYRRYRVVRIILRNNYE